MSLTMHCPLSLWGSPPSSSRLPSHSQLESFGLTPICMINRKSGHPGLRCISNQRLPSVRTMTKPGAPGTNRDISLARKHCGPLARMKSALVDAGAALDAATAVKLTKTSNCTGLNIATLPGTHGLSNAKSLIRWSASIACFIGGDDVVPRALQGACLHPSSAALFMMK